MPPGQAVRRACGSFAEIANRYAEPAGCKIIRATIVGTLANGRRIRVESFEVSWWGWLILGLVLMVLEAATPGGFFVIFFGVGALLVGLLDVAGLHLSLVLQGVMFVVTSVVALLIFRKPLLKRFNKSMPTTSVDAIEGETAQALDDIPVNGFGKAELRGTAWSARNVGDAPITRAARCRVERVEGLTLYIRT
ncbi:MAG: NfeD family protein [Acidobacteriota bacterium]